MTASSLINRRYVTIGGGTGGFTVNSGLSHFPGHPTAVCTVFDSGGSTGRLRDEYGALPQGDIRRCLLALAGDDSHTLRELFEHRFPKNGSALSEHSIGNLLLLAAEQRWGKVEGVRRISRLLNLKGDVFPVSLDSAHLYAELSDGKCVKGESAIDRRSLRDNRTIERVWLSPSALACREAVEAIVKADVIILGPGDLYTSIIPNLLVKGIVDAINDSRGVVCYVSNIMTKWSETRGFDVARFVQELRRYGIRKLDTVLVNNAPIPSKLLRFYKEKEKSTPVLCSEHMVRTLRCRGVSEVIQADYLNKSGLEKSLIRHDPYALARQIVDLK